MSSIGTPHSFETRATVELEAPAEGKVVQVQERAVAATGKEKAAAAMDLDRDLEAL
jgi:hypothetical protein